MSDFYFNSDGSDELYHYGVPGMRWGHRKQTYSDSYNNVKSTKAAYKQASKDYNKSYREASNYSSRHPFSQYTNKKVKSKSDEKWDDAIDKAAKYNKARTDYKTAKKENKQAIKSTYKKINKDSSIGDKLVFNDATRRKAAKYVVNNNMSVSDAKKKAKNQAIRNTAALLAVYGTVAVASLASKNYTTYSVTDAAGNVLKRGLMHK